MDENMLLYYLLMNLMSQRSRPPQPGPGGWTTLQEPSRPAAGGSAYMFPASAMLANPGRFGGALAGMPPSRQRQIAQYSRVMDEDTFQTPRANRERARMAPYTTPLPRDPILDDWKANSWGNETLEDLYNDPSHRAAIFNRPANYHSGLADYGKGPFDYGKTNTRGVAPESQAGLSGYFKPDPMPRWFNYWG